MNKKIKKIIIICISAIISILLLTQVFVFVIYNDNFSERFNTSEMYSDISSLKGIEKISADFKSDMNQQIKGYFYIPKGDTKAVAVLNHGFGGGGYISYASQIKVLVDNGFMVYAFDKTGNDNSEGESVKGLPQGIIDLEYALDTVRLNELSKDLPILLYGHSWGGYSVCSVLENEKDIKAAVSISGFNSSNSMMMDFIGDYGVIFKPMLAICDFIRFGKYSFMNTEKGLSKTDVPVMLIHSEDDNVVPYRNSMQIYENMFSNKDNITFEVFENKGHNAFLSQNAVNYDNMLKKEINETISKYETEEEAAVAVNAIRSNLNKDEYFELDMDLMNKIVQFYNNALEENTGDSNN